MTTSVTMTPNSGTTPQQEQQYYQQQHGQEEKNAAADPARMTTTNNDDDTKNLPSTTAAAGGGGGGDHTSTLSSDAGAAVMTAGEDMLLDEDEVEEENDMISALSPILDEDLILSPFMGADGVDGTLDIRPPCEVCHDVFCDGVHCTSITTTSTTPPGITRSAGSGTPNLQIEQEQKHHTTFVVAASAAPYLTPPPPSVITHDAVCSSSNVSSSSTSATKRRADETSIASSVSSITTSRPQGQKNNNNNNNNNKKIKKLAAGHGTFVKNLFIGVNKFSVCHPEVAKWSMDGTKFLIFDEESFMNIFHSWNLSTSSDFAYIKKQLNIYGFQVQTVLENEHDSAYLQCMNPNFARGKEYLLPHIKSTRNTKNAAVQQLIDEALAPLRSELLDLQQRVLELEINTSGHKLSLSRSGLAFTSAPKNQTLLIESTLVEEEDEDEDMDTDKDTDTDSNSVVLATEKEEDNNDRSSGDCCGDCAPSASKDAKHSCNEKKLNDSHAIVDEEEIHEKFFDVKTFIHFLLFSFVLSECFRRVMM